MGRAAVVVPNMAARLVALEDSLEMVAQEVLQRNPRCHFLLLGDAPVCNPKPVVAATLFADDLNMKSAGSATLPSRLRASCS